MDESTSSAQLEEEIAALTKNVAQLETEISQTPEPLRRSTARVVNLGRFRSFQNLFSSWNDGSPDIAKESSPVASTSQEEHQNIVEEDKKVANENGEESEDDMLFRMSDCGDSSLITGSESFLSASNNSISPAEKARIRILDILTSYFYNLRNSTLVTPWDSDGMVATALRDLVEQSDLVDHGLGVTGPFGADGAGSIGLLQMSDEEGVVYEVARYRKAILENGGEVEESVVEAANKILDFGD